MNGFFQIDGPFFKFGNLLADILLLSLFWLVCSIPIITIGASTTALFYVSTRRIADKEGYLFRDFWKSFKANFVQATLAWITILLLGGVLLFNMSYAEYFGGLKNAMLFVQAFLFFELFLGSLFVFPLLARFDMPYKALFKSAFFMANKHIFVSLLCALLAAVGIFLSWFTVITLFVAPGVYSCVASWLMMKVFKKYRPELDEDMCEDEL